jgi:hypothetical protein
MGDDSRAGAAVERYQSFGDLVSDERLHTCGSDTAGR